MQGYNQRSCNFCGMGFSGLGYGYDRRLCSNSCLIVARKKLQGKLRSMGVKNAFTRYVDPYDNTKKKVGKEFKYTAAQERRWQEIKEATGFKE